MSLISREKILVVEDDLWLAGMMRVRLASEGFTAHIENAGLPALDYAAKNKPGLVILDLHLPDIHGYEVCHKLRALCDSRFLPVIMLTGMTKPTDQLRGFSYGADAYITKPYKWNELLETIELLLGYRTLESEVFR